MNEITDALRRGDTANALELADDYTHRYPRGVFGEEAEGARILARCLASRDRSGRDAAGAFVHAHPSSLLIPRLHAVCGEPNDSNTSENGAGQ
jgi:hypothetical protein